MSELVLFVLLPHHSDTFPTTKHLVLLPLWDQGEGLFGNLFLLLLLFWRFPFPSLLLLLSLFFCRFLLLLQLVLKVLHVAFGTLVIWIYR